MTNRTKAALLLALSCAIAPAYARTMSAPSMVSMLPNVSSISPGNAAGVLQYCAGHNLVSTTSADTVLGGLTKKPNVTSSPDFAAGKAGNILGSGGKTFSIGQAPGHLKSQACDMVLKQSKHLL